MANTFHLKIVTVDGLAYEGDVQRLTFRSIHGDLAILARHITRPHGGRDGAHRGLHRRHVLHAG